MMKKIDVCCFAGAWPFHKIDHCTVKDLQKIHQENGIDSGFVSSTQAIFYNDPYEAELDLQKELAGTGYRHVMTINPTLPAWREDLRRGVHELSIAAVRIHPGYHGYELSDACMNDLMAALREYRLPLFLTSRMEDERITYLLQPRLVHWSEVGRFLEAYPDQPILLSNFRTNEIRAIGEIIRNHPQVLIDSSGLKDGAFALETVRDEYHLADRLVFGSLATVACFKSMFFAITMADASEALKTRILTGEAMRERAGWPI